MYTPSCPSPLRRQPQPPTPDVLEPGTADRQVSHFHPARVKGQTLVIFAISLLALLFFIGLAVDAGVVYVSYGQLKRAVDAGSVAAANTFKRGKSNEEMFAAVLEVLKLQNLNIDPNVLHLTVSTCDMNHDGWRDGHFPADTPLPTDFATLCPDTNPDPAANAASARKLVYVEARQATPLYFLSLLGISTVNLKTFSIAEAAAVDLVLVIDTSESMALSTTTPVAYWPNRFDFDPASCNAYIDGSGTLHPSTCYPLRNAIDAAANLTVGAPNLVDTLYEGYDNISLITFDTIAHTPGSPNTTSFSLTTVTSSNKQAIKTQINEIQLHDDAPYYQPPNSRMWSDWYGSMEISHSGLVNPANMEDRDGDGLDADPNAPCWDTQVPTQDEIDRHWDDERGVPCDYADKDDAYDWNHNTQYDDPTDSDLGAAWLSYSKNTTATGGSGTFALVSTCTGCGIRAASNELRNNGRPGAVWVIVLLSDGGVNMSDTYNSVGMDPNLIPANFPNGFCTQNFWAAFCTDGRTQNKSTYANDPYRLRYCIDKANPATPTTNPGTCPPGSVWEPRDPTNSHYSVFDYALDMVDEAALRVNRNTLNPTSPLYNQNEPLGNDIAIYTIGLGSSVQAGVPLLRYMAAVGDDGDRTTDECLSGGAVLSYNITCGQYYYAQTGNDLLPIFDSIASRIYTKITH